MIPYFPQYQQQFQQQYQPQLQQFQQQSSIVTVASEDEVLRYPVALGNSIIFKVGNQPLLIEKTMGFSPLEEPTVKRFSLIEEQQKNPDGEYATKEELRQLEAKFEQFSNTRKPARKKEADDE